MPNIPYKTSAFDTAYAEGDTEINYPFGAAEPTAVIVRQKWGGKRSTYARPAANDPLTYATALTAYFVNDENFTDREGGLVGWDRVWASLPASWSEPEEFAYVFPGYTGGAFGTGYTINGITASGANYILTNTGSSGLTAGTVVFVYVKYTRGGVIYTQSFVATTVATTNSSQFTVVASLSGTGTFSSVSGTVATATPSRASEQAMLVASLVTSDYALSTPSALDTDLPILSVFSPLDNTGAAVTVLTTGTFPTAAQYAALVAAKSQIVVECTRRRYIGNLFVRTTRTVPAL